MDNSKLKKSFGTAATSVTNLYQTSVKLQEESYKKGKIDGFNEIVRFCLESSRGNIKNVSQNEMVEFLKQKIAELESKNPQLSDKATVSFSSTTHSTTASDINSGPINNNSGAIGYQYMGQSGSLPQASMMEILETGNNETRNFMSDPNMIRMLNMPLGGNSSIQQLDSNSTINMQNFQNSNTNQANSVKSLWERTRK